MGESGGVILAGVKSITTSRTGHLFTTCAIVGDERRAVCWGQRVLGSLGDGLDCHDRGDHPAYRSLPFAVRGIDGSLELTDVRQIVSGDYFTCAIVGEAGRVYCWGDNNISSDFTGYNMLGHSDTLGCSSIPVPVSPLLSFAPMN